MLAMAVALCDGRVCAAPRALEPSALWLRRDAPTLPPTRWLSSPTIAPPGLAGWWLGPHAERLILRLPVRVFPFYDAYTIGVRADWSF
jgi:hypothetical protein